MKNARGLAVALLAAVLAFHLGEVGSQSAGAYPTKPIKLVMTLVAAGTNNIIARLCFTRNL